MRQSLHQSMRPETITINAAEFDEQNTTSSDDLDSSSSSES